MKNAAIVTVNFNTAKDTINLLLSLEKLDKRQLQLSVFVIDNGSTQEFNLGDLKFKNKITLIRSKINTGFAGGYNIGIREALRANNDYILIVNNDTKVYSDMLKNLIHAFENNTQIGVAVPKIYFAAGHEYHKKRYKPSELGKVIWYAGGSTDWNNVMSIHRGVDEVDKGQYNKSESVEFATGCCMLFKKEVLDKVGLFDEKYFLYYEDADLSERIKKAGYKICYVPKAMLIHVNAASSGGPGNKLHDYFITRNQMLFGLTYAPIRTKIALIRQSIRLLITGRPFQKKAIWDFYLNRLGKGSYI